jgi:hypothetical protein
MVNYVAGDHARADHWADCHSAPKDIPREIPDGEQESDGLR